jgi:hypothetical protein
MNFFGPSIKLCRIKGKIKGGRETFLDRIKRLDVSRQARRPRRLKDRGIGLCAQENRIAEISRCCFEQRLVAEIFTFSQLRKRENDGCL